MSARFGPAPDNRAIAEWSKQRPPGSESQKNMDVSNV
jgi:hypothetical protein